MIKKIFVAVLITLCFINMMAQDLTVRSMEVLSMDTYASVHKRVDLNKNPCAMVRVSLPISGATFSGNVVGDVKRDGSDYLVYMPAGSKKLWVKHPNFHELEVVFGDYGIDRLQSVVTYRVTVNVPQMGMPVQQDNGLTYFILNVQPKNAQVTIDGNPQPIDPNGDYSILLPRTTHTYSVVAGGYETKTETFTLGTERKRISVSLESTMANLTINSATQGSQLYLNEQLKGTTSWSGQLLPGNYVVEARLDGYYPHKQTVTLANRQQETLNIPALVARIGMLDVSYKPSDSEVWIDGKKAGLSPDIFKNLLIGSHKVSIRKEGYQTKDLTINIVDGQTTSITGSLDRNSSYASVFSSMQGKSSQSSDFTDSETFNNNDGYVDLGLPSGTLWAICNVGASSPEEFGDYFAWGEIVKKEEYTHKNSLYYKKNESTLLSKQIIDSDGNLTPVYDPATVYVGNSWRMPTFEEMEELDNKCEWEWISIKSTNGYRVTGPNGKSIFLPATGWYNCQDYGRIDVQNHRSQYWTSTVYRDKEQAQCLFFMGEDDQKCHYVSLAHRCRGLCIRPVRNK